MKKKSIFANQNKYKENMTAVELRSSIVEDLSFMSEDMLRKMSSYGKRLLMRSRKQSKPLFDTPTKVVIDGEISRLMGHFPIPVDFDEKEFIAEKRLKDYIAL